MVRFDSIKSLFFAGAILSSAIPPAGAVSPGTLTTIEAVHRITDAEAARGLPVAIEATVTYFRAYRRNMFVQDGPNGIFVKATTNLRLVPGDRVLIKGVTHQGYLPAIESSDITFLGHGAMPKAIHADYKQLSGSQDDSIRVSLRGVVRAANMDPPSAAHTMAATFKLLTDGGTVDVELDKSSQSALEDMLDAEVQVTGVAGGRFDGKEQKTGIVLHVPAMDDVAILKRAAVSPWSLPVTAMDQVQTAYHVDDTTRRVRVSGVITYFEPGSAVVLQDGLRSLWIETHSFQPLTIGDRADATGFPVVDQGFLKLSASEVRDSGIASPVVPQPATWQVLASSRHIFDLNSIEGRVAVAVREAAQDEYVLVADGYEFSAIYRHPAGVGPSSLAPMKTVPVGALIRVTGICVPLSSNPFGHAVDFNILLRSADDITVISDPPWLNRRNGTLLAGCLLFLVLAVGMRGWYLEYKNRRQIGSLAYVEKRRGQILEDVNHSKPLAGILERITELVSVRLNGAPCWCQISDGATLGNRPPHLDDSLRTVEQPISARAGGAHGSLFAAFDARTRPGAFEKEALAMAAELATLAIETSRLYSDLVHRSEFDLLTNVQNRFAMEKTLRAQIHAARQSAGIFGLIYIDLNEFKQVNDVYGHQAGDQYLQELTRRMKAQLRPGDTLARLGGDEFAVLVPRVRSRADVLEIAARLECCFNEPFDGEGFKLHGSASVGIAVYPEDANSADSLLRAADAAMYAAKYTRPRSSRSAHAPAADAAPRK